MEKFIIDRIEEHTVWLEAADKTMHRWNRSELPAGLTEGQVLLLNQDGWQVDEAEREERHASVKGRLDALFGRRNTK